MARLALRGQRGTGKFALVDAEDLERVSSTFWTLHIKGYVVNTKRVNSTTLHRFVLNAPKGSQIDHINGDKLDNRKQNLRFCSDSQNRFNTPRYRNNTSGYKGVSWDKEKKKWKAQIAHFKKHVFIGRFNSAIEAARAYDVAAMRLHGPFAKTNKILGLISE